MIVKFIIEAVVLGFILGAVVAVAIFGITEGDKPSALDVYQGKTTLQITIQDGMPIDSVVVFKEEKK